MGPSFLSLPKNCPDLGGEECEGFPVIHRVSLDSVMSLHFARLPCDWVLCTVHHTHKY